MHERTRRHLQTTAHHSNPAGGQPPQDPPVARSVWLTGQTCSRDQRRHRYLRVTHAHPAKMLPSIARYLIATYTNPGDLVFDPMAGIGTTVVEAVHLGRDGVGVEYEPRWVRLARANLDHATAHGATGHGEIIHGDARHLPDPLPADLRGRVALVVTSPPYGDSTHGHVREGGARQGRVAKVNHSYGYDRRNLAHASHDELAAGFSQILAGCRPLLRPGGRVAVTARPYRIHGELVDIPGVVAAAGTAAGLDLVERCFPLIAGIRDGRLIPRASFFQLRNIRLAHAAGDPQWLLQHETCLIFQPRRTSTGSGPGLGAEGPVGTR